MASRLMKEMEGYHWSVPLNLYSLGSSFFLAMLSDEDALEPAKLDRCDAASESCDGRWFSSWSAG